jgi:hypothetical protein
MAAFIQGLLLSVLADLIVYAIIKHLDNKDD